CGRHGGKRTYSITPGGRVDLDVEAVAAAGRERGFAVENLGDLGISLRNEDVSVSIMRRGSAVIVGPGDESGAVSLYRTLVGGEAA
ncbi:MAG: 4-methyl-5(B-hydroxyethyl)-thiazole monophosphate biosynthesis protein, partial [Nitrosopumilus sp.]|nr:4-methyl-5(B-hydroxyethyl)-thiazole monophosphate biosynthesis protein [Nitrosopumilus sp.]MDA7955539.1 4-methyl-5(B-hydroxyethyl)-thiazole monophosphate biosynthesis protein [Nitrosopumilus sp.]